MIEGNGTSGFIKVKKNNEWGSVCDDYWTDEDANVACGQLGFLPYGNHFLTPCLFHQI